MTGITFDRPLSGRAFPERTGRCRVAPSILAANFGWLAQEVNRVAAAGADLIHVDVMDGHFVTNITIGPPVVSSLRKATELPLDVHLMIENPRRYIPQFAAAGADIISIHVEASDDLAGDIALIRSHHVSPGVVVNPGTSVEKVYPVLDKVDMVLVMSVQPGFGGQKFLPGSLSKLTLLKTLIVSQGLPVALEVDGGINAGNAEDVVNAGADFLVAGSSVFCAPDYAAAIKSLKG